VAAKTIIGNKIILGDAPWVAAPGLSRAALPSCLFRKRLEAKTSTVELQI
jgi:hypothetical protein